MGSALLSESRHEMKFEIAPWDVGRIRRRLRFVAEPDVHGIQGTYQVRSLYFDTVGGKALWEKISGVNGREKFRLRCYGHNDARILLEKKSSLRGMTRKLSVSLKRSEAEKLLRGQPDWYEKRDGRNGRKSDNQLLDEFYVKTQAQGLRPKTLVEYTREAYDYLPQGCGQNNAVRVTFDSRLCTGVRVTDFLNFDCPMVPVGRPAVLMEVKWNHYLPDVVRSAIQVPGRPWQSFSKYAQCRVFD
ncbi:MAG: polyphosphate polymerase domain-containing protein [Oscillibacter sp.]|nr:polyphosphate polymerase domain-containing protein [Oscillibacter sp.]